MVINQGDLFWLDLPEAKDSRPAYSHPCVWAEMTSLTTARSRPQLYVS